MEMVVSSFQGIEEIMQAGDAQTAGGFQTIDPCVKVLRTRNEEGFIGTECRQHSEILPRRADRSVMIQFIAGIIDRAQDPDIEFLQNPSGAQIAAPQL